MANLACLWAEFAPARAKFEISRSEPNIALGAGGRSSGHAGFRPGRYLLRPQGEIREGDIYFAPGSRI